MKHGVCGCDIGRETESILGREAESILVAYAVVLGGRMQYAPTKRFRFYL